MWDFEFIMASPKIKKKSSLQSGTPFLSQLIGKDFHPPSEIIDFTTHHHVVSLQIETNQLTNLFLEHVLSPISVAVVQLEDVLERI